MTAILLYQPESAAQPGQARQCILLFLEDYRIGIDHRSFLHGLACAPSRADPLSTALSRHLAGGGASLAEQGSPFGDREFSVAGELPESFRRII